MAMFTSIERGGYGRPRYRRTRSVRFITLHGVRSLRLAGRPGPQRGRGQAQSQAPAQSQGQGQSQKKTGKGQGQGLSHKQLAQRRAAGKALAAKVGRDYFKWLGRLGGRKYMLRAGLALAESWNFSAEEIKASKVSAERRAELVAEMRTHYREQALERYGAGPAKGQKVMLEVWEPGGAGHSRPRPRKPQKKG